MKDRRIILEVLELLVPNEHPILYQYITVLYIDTRTMVDKLVKIIKNIFNGVYEYTLLSSVCEEFIKNKKIDYYLGRIKINNPYT